MHQCEKSKCDPDKFKMSAFITQGQMFLDQRSRHKVPFYAEKLQISGSLYFRLFSCWGKKWGNFSRSAKKELIKNPNWTEPGFFCFKTKAALNFKTSQKLIFFLPTKFHSEKKKNLQWFLDIITWQNREKDLIFVDPIDTRNSKYG